MANFFKKSHFLFLSLSLFATFSKSKSVIEDKNKHLHQAEPRVHAAV